MKKIPKKLLIILGSILLLLIVLLIILFTVLNPIATKIANAQLKKLIATEAKIESISLRPLRGKLTVKGFSIKQPKGFTGEYLLSIARTEVNISLSALLIKHIVVDNITVSDANIFIEQKSNKMNIDLIMKEQEKKQAAPKKSENPKTETKASEKKKEPLPISVHELELSKFNIRFLQDDYTDISIKQLKLYIKNVKLHNETVKVKKILNSIENLHLMKKLQEEDKEKEQEEIILIANMSNINVSIDNIYLNGNENGTLPLKAEITGLFTYEDRYPPCYFGLYSRVGKIQQGNIPPANIALNVIGLELNELEAVLDPKSHSAIGGDAIDVESITSLSDNYLDSKIIINTIGRNKLNAKIRGTPREPETDPALAGILAYGRVKGLLGKPVAGAVGIVKGVGAGAGALGKGTVGIVKGVGRGAGGIVKGTATLDPEEAKGGAGEATVGTVKGAGETAGETVETTGKETGEGAKQTVVTKEEKQKWRQAKEKRWNATWDKAKETIEKKPAPTQ
jgi:hypothetical protein